MNETNTNISDQNQTQNVTANDQAKDTQNSKQDPDATKQQEQNQDKPESDGKGQSLAKQIAKMRKRIDAEAGQKHDYQNQLEESQKQVKTLTQKLADLTGNKDDTDANQEALSKAQKENASLKAQLARIDQIGKVSAQFAEAGVQVPQNILNLVVPSGADEKQISENMNALSVFYDSIVSNVKKSFLKSPTPRINGSDVKPFDRAELAKIKDPLKRIKIIKEHLSDFN